MGEKKKTQKNEGQKKENKSDAPRKDETTTPSPVVLKVDMHCDGCASRIIRCVKGFQGVQTVKADSDSGKLTITGNVEPLKLRDKLAEKTKKKVDILSPQPKKDTNDSKSDKKKSDDKPEKKKNLEDKKSKEPQVTTVVLKVAFHCQGCIERIRKTVSKTKGVQELSIDKEKETITVKGTMDVKALVESLMERLKRKVEVVPPKKDKDKDKEKEKDKKEKEKEKEGNGGEKEGGGKGGGKKKSGGDNKKVEEVAAGGGGGEGGGGKFELSKMEFVAPPYGYGYGYGYNNYGPLYYMEPVAPPQMFSDENPNACSIM